MGKHRRNEKKAEQDVKPSRWETILTIIFIILVLLALLLTGGNNQTCYPGKPYNER